MRSVTVQFRPWTTWPGKETPGYARQRSRFKAQWTQTRDLLDRELHHLRAKNIVIELNCDEREIRNDGMPRADARVRGPGVILSFESPHGPLRYPCDTYTHWQDNVRAIALALEALRAVDRYGVTKRGEQYTGWKALPASTLPSMSAEQAASRVAINASPGAILGDRSVARDAVRLAMQRTHPDRTGNGDGTAFALVQEAKRVLEAHHGGAL